jgi:two-component system LytT family response regulator
MTCILIDDEPDCLELLALLIQKYCPELHIIGQFGSPKEGIDAIWENRPDLLFLDVDMPEITDLGCWMPAGKCPFR